MGAKKPETFPVSMGLTDGIFTGLDDERVVAFFKGEQILPSAAGTVTEKASDHLNRLLTRIRAGEKADLIFDLDGILFPVGIETITNVVTLDKWTEENKSEIDRFKQGIKLLQGIYGFRVGISTGRGFEFTKKVANAFFTDGNVDFIGAEGGGVIASKPKNGKEWEPRESKNMNQDSLKLLKQYKSDIIREVANAGGDLEDPTKLIRLTLTPPRGISGGEFKEEVINIINKLAEINSNQKESAPLQKLTEGITHTPVTVEVMPVGVDKLSGVKETSGQNIKIFFGDANTDKSIMMVADVNVSPANAEEGIKQFIRRGESSHPFIGILTSGTLLNGVNEALSTIILLFQVG